MTTYTAVRTWNRKHTAATVTVTDDQGTVVAQAGGKRAARAEAVIITQFKADEAGPGLYGCRADLHAAQVEVEKLLRGGTRKTRGYEYPVHAWHFALAVPVVEARTDYERAFTLDGRPPLIPPTADEVEAAFRAAVAKTL